MQLHRTVTTNHGKLKKTRGKYKRNMLRFGQNKTAWEFILFPEARAIARARVGTHASKFTYAIYRTREIIVFSRKEKFFIEGFSIEHN